MDKGQSRGKQTAIIVTAIFIAAIGVVTPGILKERREYNAIYPGCWTLFDDGDSCEMSANVNAYIRGQ